MSDRIAVMDAGAVLCSWAPRGDLREPPERTFVRRVHRRLQPAAGHRGGPGRATFRSDSCSTGAVPTWLRGRRLGLPLGAAGEDLLDDIEEGMVSVEGESWSGSTSAQTQVIVQLAPDVRVVALEQNTARSRADDRWEIGHRVRLGWHPEHARVLVTSYGLAVEHLGGPLGAVVAPRAPPPRSRRPPRESGGGRGRPGGSRSRPRAPRPR